MEQKSDLWTINLPPASTVTIQWFRSPRRNYCYIFAVNSILKNHAEPEAWSNYSIRVPQVCNSGWIHHISLADSEPRFKPTLITKTNQQLEEYRMRQLRACKRVYELASSSAKLENYGAVEFATDKCNNIYNSPCPLGTSQTDIHPARRHYSAVLWNKTCMESRSEERGEEMRERE